MAKRDETPRVNVLLAAIDHTASLIGTDSPKVSRAKIRAELEQFYSKGKS